jgi:hypothetical protein
MVQSTSHSSMYSGRVEVYISNAGGHGNRHPGKRHCIMKRICARSLKKAIWERTKWSLNDCASNIAKNEVGDKVIV